MVRVRVRVRNNIIKSCHVYVVVPWRNVRRDVVHGGKCLYSGLHSQKAGCFQQLIGVY